MIIGIDASRANMEHKSGTEWYAYYIIRWLSKLDPDNQYILYTDKPLSRGLLDLTTPQYFPDAEKYSRIEFDKQGYQMLKSKYNNFRGSVLGWPFKHFWTQGRLSLEMLFNKPDLLFIPSHVLPVIHPRNSIVTIHDIGFVRDRFLYRKSALGPEIKIFRKLINFLFRLFTLGKYCANTYDYLLWSTEYALKKAKTIITVSNFTKHEIQEYYNPDSKKIKIVHNGYNKYIYKKITDKNKIVEVLSKYGIEPPYLLYVGRIDKKKNIPALIEAYAIMREQNADIFEKLILAGDAYYGYDETNYMISEFALDDEVIMPGWIEEEDMPYLYNAATAFVFPSYYEGFGIPLLQAMACGTPIAASHAASIPEVVGDAALLFNPIDVRDIADCLEKIVIDKPLRAKLLESGKKRIENFSWEITAGKILEIFKRHSK